MKKRNIAWIGCALTALLCAALLIPGCSQDQGSEALPTGSTAFSPSSELARTTAPLAHGDSNSDDSESEGDESEDSESEDNDSEDTESEDDDSVDSESVDEDSPDDGSLDDDGTRVRDLLFAFAGCPPALTIGATSVMTTEGTRFDCEPGCNGLQEGLTAAEFCSFLAVGLPMRARGTDNAGTIDASRARIDDEIKATGVISAASSDLGGGFTLNVDGLILAFQVGAGAQIDVFDAGATVRVEGTVPALSGGLPIFTATEIQN